MPSPVRNLFLACLTTMVLTGCNSEPFATENEGLAAPKSSAKLEKQTFTLPARYGAALPNSVATWKAWQEGGDLRFPPPSHTGDLIAQGDADYFQRLLRAAQSVVATERLQWSELWRTNLRYQDANTLFCEQAKPVMLGESSAARSALWSLYAMDCASIGEIDLLLRADTPARAVIDLYQDDTGDERPKSWPFRPALLNAARDIISTGTISEARTAAFQLAEMRDVRALAGLRDIYGSLHEQPRAKQVAMAFFRSADAADRAIAERVCQQMSKPDVMCQEASQSPEGLDEVSQMTLTNDQRKTVQQRIDQLQTAGFADAAAVDFSALDDDRFESILTAAGRAYWFDVETDNYPNQHDHLMRKLARLVRPALDGAVFEEQAPPLKEGDSSNADIYELFVYADGLRWHISAEDLGDWYDLDKVLILLNRVLIDRGSAQRLRVLQTQDQTATVVGGSVSALQNAFRSGILRAGGAQSAESSGKAFERKVRDQLEHESTSSLE
jgi:hypothetical protein